MNATATAWERAGFNVAYVPGLTAGFVVYPPARFTGSAPVAMLPHTLLQASPDDLGAAIETAIRNHSREDTNEAYHLAVLVSANLTE